MKHQLHKCDDPDCSVCEGGLALCEVCGGAEASLPTDCPGRKMTVTEADNVQAGNVDFIDGIGWRTASPE